MGKGNESPALVTAVSLDDLPKSGRGASELSADESALMAAIAGAAKDDKTYAQLPTVIASKDDAEKRAAQIKRNLRKAGVVPAGKAPRSRLIAVDGGFQIAAGFGNPGKAPQRKPKAS